MADIVQALKWLAEGKKITREHWDTQHYIFIFENEIVDEELCSAKALLTGSCNWKLFEVQ